MPDSLNDLTVKQFIDLNKNLNQLELLSSMSGLNLSFIENSDTDLQPAITYLNKVFSKVPPDIKKMKKGKITFEGKTIKPPKNLNFTKFGQKIMIKNLIESEANLESMVAEVFAIYIQPVIDGKFDSKRIPEIQKKVNQMKIVEVFSWVVFFFLRLKILKRTFQVDTLKYQPLLRKNKAKDIQS